MPAAPLKIGAGGIRSGHQLLSITSRFTAGMKSKLNPELPNYSLKGAIVICGVWGEKRVAYPVDCFDQEIINSRAIRHDKYYPACSFTTR